MEALTEAIEVAKAPHEISALTESGSLLLKTLLLEPLGACKVNRVHLLTSRPDLKFAISFIPVRVFISLE